LSTGEAGDSFLVKLFVQSYESQLICTLCQLVCEIDIWYLFYQHVYAQKYIQVTSVFLRFWDLHAQKQQINVDEID